MDGPLVTFALLSYNQEPFIREAVEAALAQSYRPLEIILSDDASSDGTFAIMESMAARYGGPHELTLNRNQTRLGIGAHLNRVMDLARGELVVGAAGDDVSHPDRTSRLVEAWLSGGRKARGLYSTAMMIDVHGAELGLLAPELGPGDLAAQARNRTPGFMGCSEAWSAELFRVFGPILPGTVFEDRVLAFRALLLGGIHRVDEALVRYRVHAASVSRHVEVPTDKVLEVTLLMHERNESVWANYLRDLDVAERHGRVDPAEATRTRTALTAELSLVRQKIRFLRGGIAEKLKVIASALVMSPRQALRWTVILLAPWAYLRSQRKNMPGI